MNLNIKTSWVIRLIWSSSGIYVAIYLVVFFFWHWNEFCFEENILLLKEKKKPWVTWSIDFLAFTSIVLIIDVLVTFKSNPVNQDIDTFFYFVLVLSISRFKVSSSVSNQRVSVGARFQLRKCIMLECKMWKLLLWKHVELTDKSKTKRNAFKWCTNAVRVWFARSLCLTLTYF